MYYQGMVCNNCCLAACEHTTMCQNWGRTAPVGAQFWHLVVYLMGSLRRQLGAVSIWRCHLTGIGISMLKIRRSWDRLIFNMGIPIPGKDGLYIESGSWRRKWRFMLLNTLLHMENMLCIYASFISIQFSTCYDSNLFGRHMPKTAVNKHVTCIAYYSILIKFNGNIFRVTGPLCGEFIGHRWSPLTKASDAELWCFLWSAPE